MIKALAPLALISLAACQTVADLPEERLGSATLTMANGVPVGTAQLLARGDTVTLAFAGAALPAGAHGFHLHTTGTCTAPDFTSAGGHLNPRNNEHGSLNPAGKHLGDLPNLTVGANGTASTQVDLDGTRAYLMDVLFDADGTAVMIHAGPDDYRSDPAGDAGSRIACGVLKRS